MSRLLDVYEGVESLYMSDYHAVVELDALPGDGTRIRWHGTYTVPSEMREDFQGYLGGIMQDMANGLAAQAALPAEGPVERQPVLGQRGEAPVTDQQQRGVVTMTLHDPVVRLRDAINSRDPQRIADCFTPDYRSEIPHRPAESFTGSDRVAANWTAIFARLPDLHARVLRRAADGDELWSEWEMTGTDAAGNPALLCGPVIMTTRDGQIAWTRFYLSPVAAPTVCQ